MKQYILPLTALLVLVMYIYPTVFKRNEEPRHLLSLENVKEIEIRRGERVLRFEKNEKGWIITSPVKDRVEEDKIRRLLNSMKQTELDTVITEDPERYKDFKVTEKNDYVYLKSDKGKLKVYLGKAGPRYPLAYLRIEGDKKIYLVDATFKDYLPRDANDFRDRTILSLKMDEIKSISWKTEDDTFLMKKEKNRWLTPSGIVEQKKAEDYLRKVSHIVADGFPEGNKIPDDAARKATLRIDSSTGERTLYLFEKDKKFYIKYDKRVFTISEDKMKDLLQKLPPSTQGAAQSS